MDNPGLQPPMPTPPVTPSPPVIPPAPPPPPVVPEEPIIQKPVNPTGKKIKKNLPKLAVGTLVMALLVGGLFLGKNLLQERQRPIQPKAAGGPYCSGVCAEGTSCRIDGCKTQYSEIVEMVRYRCDQISPEGCNGVEVDRKFTDSMAFQEDCGSEQIDAYGYDGGWAHKDYDQDCGGEEPSPSPSPSVSPSPSPLPERQDICGTTGSTSIDKSSIQPGESATVTSITGGTPVNKFSFAMYNRDNEYGPGNPKPICVAGSGGVQGDCPPNSHHLILADDDQTTMRTTGSKTFTYEAVFVADENWEEGRRVERIQINGYFQIGNGPVSLPNPRCVTYTASRLDYCVSASADKATMNPGETLTLSSVSNPPVNSFFYTTYNLDNLYGPGNPKPVCVGTGTDAQCPNGGKPLVFSDPNNTTIAGQGLRTNGSAQVPYASLFVTDNSSGQQVKNVQFNAYFSLNGGPWSLPNPACVAYTKMGTPTLACVDLTKDVAAPKLTDEVTFTCEANFSSGSPVAYFRHKVGSASYIEDIMPYPINTNTHKASKGLKIDQLGDWTVQCRVCTDSTKTTCTPWGQAK